jgi:UDP-3-O-[3-hydroxymyristoyl] glucosamine N-acyltransferase
MKVPEIRASDLAKKLGCTIIGDGDVVIKGAASLERAGENDLTFFSNVKFKKALSTTSAGAVVSQAEIGRDDITVIISANPTHTFARALWILYPPSLRKPSISPLAAIHEESKVSEFATLMPYCCIEKGATVEENVFIYPGVYVGEDVYVGENTILYPSVTVYHGCKIGKNVIIHAGAVIGGDGFGFARHGGGYLKIPQIGTVVIEDDVEIGCNTTVDRAALGVTRLKRGTKLDNLVQVGHNVEIGEDCVIASQAGIAGSVKIGDWVMIGGQTGVADHLEIDSGIMVAGKSGVPWSLSAKKSVGWSGIPALPHKKWLRIAVSLEKIPDMIKKIGRLEEELEKVKSERED